jgi:hypothetical protein
MIDNLNDGTFSMISKFQADSYPVRKAHPPTQLELPGSLTDLLAVREKLTRAKEGVNDLYEENRALKDELRAVRLAGRQALDTVYRRLDALQANNDFLYELLRTPTSPSHVASRPDALAHRTLVHHELTKLLSVVHPDKWQGSPVAEELTKAVLELRERLKEGGV